LPLKLQIACSTGTKVFAFFIAIPASIIIIGLTVVGIEKVSDMNTVIKNGENQLQETLKAATTNAETIEKRVADLKIY